MNERRGNSLGARRKSGLHITGDRIHPHYSHRLHNPYFGRVRDHGYTSGSAHLQRPRGRYFNGHPGLRTTSAKENLNRNASQPGRGVSDIPSKQIHTKRILNSTSSVSKNGREDDKPATFVCEGIEVDFDSSDSEEDVRPWRIVKVLKKNDSKNEDALQINSVEEDSRRQDVIPQVQGKVLLKQDLLNKQQNGVEVPVQISSPPANSVIIPPSGRSSFVVLSGLKKNRPTPNSTGPMSNCAIIKRPRFLFSQQVRPTTRHPHPQVPYPRIQENASNSSDENADLNLQKERIIEDVLDMMEEVELRARFLNYP